MWQPPPDGDARAILHEANTDVREGRPEVALEKFLWYHRHAKEFDPGLSPVRLSFALGYWQDLAEHYPPALEAMIRVRDETESEFRKTMSDFELFQDLAALNERLDQNERTAQLFREVAVIDHASAAKLYRVAERRLVAAGDYRTCNSFLNPKECLKSAAESHRRMREEAESYLRMRNGRQLPSGHRIPDGARICYMQKVSTLAGLLVLNDRHDEARDVYQQSLLVVDDEEFRATMDMAMSGHLMSLEQLSVRDSIKRLRRRP